MTAARSKARKRALDVLYESDVRGEDTLGILRAKIDRAEPPIAAYAAEIVEGVVAHRDRIDALLETYSVGWTLARMPAVDRNILRIGAYELLWEGDVPDGVVLAEAVGLARELSTEASPVFVNGLLFRLCEVRETLSL